MQLRLPRTLFGVLVGAGLSIVGMCYQALFRNYLASPFSLGVSSGAALAASTALVLGATISSLGIDITIWAMLGALCSIVFITTMSERMKSATLRGDQNTLLLVGIIFTFFCSSVMTLIQYVADYAQLFRLTRWMMGGISVVGWDDLGIGAVLVGVTYVWLVRHTRALDLILFGDDIASVKGIDVMRMSHRSFVITSFLIGWVVAHCGIIGFVGIIVPACARLIVGSRHAALLPLAGILGAILVVACDTLGRVVIAPFEVPAGVFTSVVGGPLFIVLMMRGRARQ
jgi:iron complex transport system permease protein